MKNFNDPFEFLHRFEEDETPTRRLELLRQRKTNDHDGFICFSHEDTLLNPLLWSHYADHHRGIALGFEFRNQTEVPSPVGKEVVEGLAEAHAVEIDYRENSEERVDISGIEGISLSLLTGEAEKLWYTKGEAWNYEKEWRVRYPLDAAISLNGMHFVGIDSTPPCQIVLGWKCPLKYGYFAAWLKERIENNQSWNSTQILRMKPHTTEFKLEAVKSSIEITESENELL